MPDDGDMQGRILVVYDSRVIRETVSVLGIEDDFAVMELDDPAAAAGIAAEHAPDIVVICAMSRNTTAFDTCRAIKDATAEAYLPVVIYSINAGESARRKALECGADDLVQVTIAPEDLVYRISTLLRIKALVRESQQRTRSLARASAEAADMMLHLEEADRRIREQNEQLERMVRELEDRDRRISAQQQEISSHLETLKKEMELASALQINLLPSGAPEVRGMALHDRYVPAAQLCGDYYDYMPVPGGEFNVSVADVTGHGVAPALVSVQVRTMARGAILLGKDPAAVLRGLNEFVLDTFKREFLLTMVCLSFDPRSGTVTYSGAGHCPLLLLRNDGQVEEYPSRGMPLGVSAAAPYLNETCALETGEKLLLYTDGIFEVKGEGGEIFGPDRVKETLSLQRGHSGHDVLDGLFRAARSFSVSGGFEDDVTLVLLERTPY